MNKKQLKEKKYNKNYIKLTEKQKKLKKKSKKGKNIIKIIINIIIFILFLFLLLLIALFMIRKKNKKKTSIYEINSKIEQLKILTNNDKNLYDGAKKCLERNPDEQLCFYQFLCPK